MATLADRVWVYLIAQGIVRDPRVAGVLPPAFRSPADGVAAPGEGTGTEVGLTAVLGISADLGIPAPYFEAERRKDIVDFVYRTAKRPQADALYSLIRQAMIGPVPGAPFRMNWSMAGMRVIQSREWQGLQRIASDGAQGFTMKSSVILETYAEDHF